MWQPPPGFPFVNAPTAGGGQASPYGTAAYGAGSPPAGGQCAMQAGPFGVQPATRSLPLGFPAWMAEAAGLQQPQAPQALQVPTRRAAPGPAYPTPQQRSYPAPQPQSYPTAQPQQAQQRAAVQGRKKALIVAVSYRGTASELKGPLNDAKLMRALLRDKCGFGPDDLMVMWEDMEDPQRLPTHSNIMLGLRWLMCDLHEGDSLVLYYSGHGGCQPLDLGSDAEGNRCVQLLQTLLPLDFKAEGFILDTELNRLLVNQLPAGVKLTAIIDACHCGTLLELPYRATVSRGHAKWEAVHEERPDRATAGGFAVQFSSCMDLQASADTAWFTRGKNTGAATFCFIHAIERRGVQLSYEQLLVEMHYSCKEELAESQGDPTTSDYQDVHLSASFAFDLNAPFSL